MEKFTLRLEELPAKSSPFQSIVTHGIVSGVIAQTLLDTALAEGVREKLAQRLGVNGGELSRLAGYVVSLHDIGKLAPAWMTGLAAASGDGKLADALRAQGLGGVTRTGIRHEMTGRRILQSLWQERQENAGAARMFAGVVGAHHQGKSGNHEFRDRSPWKPYWLELETRMADTFSVGERRLPDMDTRTDAFVEVVINGLMIMADWIASGPAFSDAEHLVASGALSDIKERANTFVRSSGLASAPPDFGTSFSEVWPAFGDQPRPLQLVVEGIFQCDAADPPLLVLIEAPMGEGKTEAAVYAAAQMLREWKKDGVYFALPTGATANQMWTRITSFLRDANAADSVRLLHSMAWLAGDDDAEADISLVQDAAAVSETDVSAYSSNEPDSLAAVAAEWLQPGNRALLGHWGVGTVDQAMMAAMFIKYGVFRLLGLAQKVVIIDEVHAYDAYMNEIILRLLEWCRELEIPMVLLSATLPPDIKHRVLSVYANETSEAAYPAVTCVRKSGKLQTYPVDETLPRDDVRVETYEILYDHERIGALALELAQEGGCVGVLLNTVKDAQKVFQEIARQQGSLRDLYLFHSQFPAGRRAEIETECLRLFSPKPGERANRAILVCTQVAEQSLDIDMDVLATAVAPADLILQRMGRMHRHASTARPDSLRQPTLHLLLPAEEEEYGRDAVIYPECFLRRSAQLFTSGKVIRLPEDILELVTDAYEQDFSDDELQSWFEELMKESNDRAESAQYTLEAPEYGFEPVRHTPAFDDMEDHGYLTAQTRLGRPTVRIALLESDLYRRVQSLASDGVANVFDRDLATAVMKRSVSIPEAYVKDIPAPLAGGGRLRSVQIYPSENDAYAGPDGTVLEYDHSLGFMRQSI